MKKLLIFLLGIGFGLGASFTFKSVYSARWNYYYNQALKEDPNFTKYPNLSSRIEYVHEHMSYTEDLIEHYLEEGSSDCFGPMNPGGPMPIQCDLVHKIYKSITGEKP